MLQPADFRRPKNFHKIAGGRLGEIVEVSAETELVKKPRRAGAIGVPSAPDAFAVPLIPNHELIEGRIIEMEQPRGASRFDCLHENKISRAGAVARRCRGRQDEEFSGFKVRRRLQTDRGKTRGRIFPAMRHLVDLFQDQTVEIHLLADGFVNEKETKGEGHEMRGEF